MNSIPNEKSPRHHLRGFFKPSKGSDLNNEKLTLSSSGVSGWKASMLGTAQASCYDVCIVAWNPRICQRVWDTRRRKTGVVGCWGVVEIFFCSHHDGYLGKCKKISGVEVFLRGGWLRVMCVLMGKRNSKQFGIPWKRLVTFVFSQYTPVNKRH